MRRAQRGLKHTVASERPAFNMIDPLFWKNQRVFVTGLTGFKGAWLTVWLEMLGAEMAGYALVPDTEPSAYEALGLSRLCAPLIADIREFDALQTAIEVFRPTIIFHLAAQSLVLRSYANPLETFQTNVMGTVNLLQAARTAPSLKALINVTTDKIYENSGSLRGLTEKDRLGAADPYSTSKAASELVTDSFRQAFFNGSKSGVPVIATARSGNTIGGGDWNADRIIPDAVRAFSTGRPVTLRNPGAVRPWQHVLEPLSGYLLLAESCVKMGAEFAGGWNFGPAAAQTVTVHDMIKEFCGLWGHGARYREAITEGDPHEAVLLVLNSDKAEIELGWRPSTSLRTALKLTADWYRRFYDGGGTDDLLELTRRQIAVFSDAR